MIPEHENVLAEQVAVAAETLLSGGVVAFPTDTVYGLGALYDNSKAVRRIFDIKGRERTKALPLIVANRNQLEDVACSERACVVLLMQAFWPGPLTLVLPKTKRVGCDVTGGLDTVAVRMPDHPVALMLAIRAGGAICATSANISGREASLTACEVERQLGSSVDYIIRCDAVGSGIPSTIIDATGDKIRIIREGTITREKISRICEIF
ncbi:MAG: L-threonylcarbamoyladenylate synthase [Dehalococcoidales bacterium]|nr:L-threonylcarbamoyladenylate synthase [Dehalococcoidales bacterium]MDD4465120.1 L-threonylcarbamoyladenylate synthase [Dehalococcoidales bacterium]